MSDEFRVTSGPSALMGDNSIHLSPEAALWAVEVGGAAYSDEPELQILMGDAGWTSARLEDEEPAQMAVIESDGAIALAFRGTDGLEDVRADLAMARKVRWGPVPVGKVGVGPVRQLRLLESGIAAALDRSGDKDVYIAGHSLGGTLALGAVCMIHSWGSGARVKMCVAVESPKFFDETARDWYLGKDGPGVKTFSILQILDGVKDQVPRLPTSGMGFPYLWESAESSLTVFKDGEVLQGAPATAAWMDHRRKSPTSFWKRFHFGFVSRWFQKRLAVHGSRGALWLAAKAWRNGSIGLGS